LLVSINVPSEQQEQASSMPNPAPFAPFEWKIAFRYLRARRTEGGVSGMAWISLIGITLAVFALVATLAVRTGLREETVRTILGANAHLEVLYHTVITDDGRSERVIRDFDALSARLIKVPGVLDAVPVVKGQVIGNIGENNAPLELYGIRIEDLKRFPSVAEPDVSFGDLSRLAEGIALGAGLARSLNAGIGDRVKVISPNGTRTPFGIKPRVSVFEVVYVFRSGQAFIDTTRAYLPLSDAQPFLNREGAVDQIEVMVDQPDAVGAYVPSILAAAGDRAYAWTWQDRSGGFLRALALQDNALFVLLGILVLIAAMNIVSGLIMLVKNKGRDIGILRTMGLDRGTILRVFFLVGASIGMLGTVCGVMLGAVFAANIDMIYSLIDVFTGGGKAQLEAQGFFFPPAVLRLTDVLAAVVLSLGLSFVITIFPARRAARMDPVEALRYE
jgi:lipoprotein-releasing system permease protein